MLLSGDKDFFRYRLSHSSADASPLDIYSSFNYDAASGQLLLEKATLGTEREVIHLATSPVAFKDVGNASLEVQLCCNLIPQPTYRVPICVCQCSRRRLHYLYSNHNL